MTLTFYLITQDYRVVNKTLGTAIGTAVGVLHEKVNDLKMSIKLPSALFNTVTGSNYVFIDTTQAYYYRESYNIENDCVIIDLRMDVRKTFAAQIKNINATVNRNEMVRNGYLNDTGYNSLAYQAVQYKTFPNALDDASYILVTVG